MIDAWRGVLRAARELASILPKETIEALCGRLIQSGEPASDAAIVAAVASASGRDAVSSLIRVWRRDVPELPAVAVAAALASAAEVDDAWRDRQRVEVVWTGVPQSE